MTRNPAKALALAALIALPMAASAQLSANVSLTSNYKYRGQDQSVRDGKFLPALQGGFDYAHSSGFYVGNWNSTVDFGTPSGGNLEMDLYGGYKFSYSDFAFDVGLLRYQYPGFNLGNTTELYGAVTWGPVTAKYSHTLTDGYFGVGKATSDGRGTGYLNISFAQEVAPKTTLKAGVGFTNFKGVVNSAGVPDYTDYSIGAAYDFGDGFSLSGAIVGASKKGSFLKPSGQSVNQNVLLVTITKTM
ncbi:MAG: hypothetical protein EOO22_19315 [Comamonadaceae bacterium]|nr:MAG: hypothetical protein EOO22_19315 [Comamonadaceae bacterium]